MRELVKELKKRGYVYTVKESENEVNVYFVAVKNCYDGDDKEIYELSEKCGLHVRSIAFIKKNELHVCLFMGGKEK